MQAPKCKLASSPGAQPRNSEQPAPKLGASQLCWPRGQRIYRLKHVFAAVTGPGTSALNKVEVDSSHVTAGRCGGPVGVRGAGAGPGPSQQEGEGRGGDLLCLDRTHWTVSRHFRPQKPLWPEQSHVVKPTFERCGKIVFLPGAREPRGNVEMLVLQEVGGRGNGRQPLPRTESGCCLWAVLPGHGEGQSVPGCHLAC